MKGTLFVTSALLTCLGLPGVARCSDWPTYRHDASRSGVANTVVDAKLAPVWETRLDGCLTAPVVAGGMLVTTTPENHSVHALSSGSGEPIWNFTAGGPIAVHAE